MECLAIAAALFINFNNLKYSVKKKVYIHTFCVHLTLYICASVCPVEQLITEHLINIATTAHQTPVLAKNYRNLCLTLVVGYIKP